MMIHDPEILDAAPVDQAKVWAECNAAAGQVSNPDGSINLRAAHAADPGCCTCPACGATHWNIGQWHRCRECAFVYPTDAWPMFSWGVQAGWREPGERYRHELRLAHPYYAAGFRMTALFDRDASLYCEFGRIDWKDLMKNVTPDLTMRRL